MYDIYRLAVILYFTFVALCLAIIALVGVLLGVTAGLILLPLPATRAAGKSLLRTSTRWFT
jgi:hypothetical protein